MAKQPWVFFIVGTPPLQRKRNRRREKVDNEECKEEQHQFVEAGGIGRVRMEVLLHEIPDRAHGKHDVDHRRHQRQQNLENPNIWQRNPPQRTFAGHDAAMLVDRLQDPEGPAETLSHQAIRIRRRLGISECHVFVLDAISSAQQGHRQVGIFGDGIDVVATRLLHRGDSPCSNRTRHDADCSKNVERSPLKILAGDVFQRLPARPHIDAVPNLGIARDGANLRIDKVWNEP